MSKKTTDKVTQIVITEGNIRGVIKGQNKPDSGANLKPIAPPPSPKPKKTKKS